MRMQDFEDIYIVFFYSLILNIFEVLHVHASQKKSKEFNIEFYKKFKKFKSNQYIRYVVILNARKN